MFFLQHYLAVEKNLPPALAGSIKYPSSSITWQLK
jgi:hypothetical protein